MFKKNNYLKNLIHYLNEFKQISLDSEKDLKSINEYLVSRLNKDSATDNNVMLKVSKLLEKFSYCSKYIDVTLDFYEVLNAE